jgi:uncharacterized NAD(P)/FAD-binding protein YdhS
MFNSLITFNRGSSTAAVKRQANQAQSYNVTQEFATSPGTSYTLGVYASSAQNGDAAPVCSITICADNDCSPPQPVTSTYVLYAYQYNAQATNSNITATYSVSCVGSAYIALDEIAVVANSQNTPPTRTVTQYITRTGDPVTELQGPVTATTILWSTATSIVQIPDTQYISLFSTALLTATSTLSALVIKIAR